jgi:hypothetical protein
VSTNYYLDSPDNEAGHLGKWANGRFIAKAPAGVDTFDAWAAQLVGHRIFAEHAVEYAADEMTAIALERWANSFRRSPRYSAGEFVDRGVLFVRHEFC